MTLKAWMLYIRDKKSFARPLFSDRKNNARANCDESVGQESSPAVGTGRSEDSACTRNIETRNPRVSNRENSCTTLALLQLWAVRQAKVLV
jgi:hypothetical protein